MGSPITKVDTVGIPAQDAERSRRFYLETLGVTPDEHARYEFWIGDTCHMAPFVDPDGNQLVLHKRYAPYDG